MSDMGNKNNIHVDVYNADGTLAQHEEGHNFVSINLKEFGKLALRGMLTNRKAYNRTYSSYAHFDFIDSEMINTMYCTDSTDAESPTTEITIPGNTIAYATLNNAYAQTTGTRGSVSTALSVCDNKKAKFVCEWNESTGNGTFQSVCLGNKSLGIVPEMIPYDFEKEFIGIAYGGGYYWTGELNTKTILKLNATTFAIEEEIDVSSVLVANVRDLTYYNGSLYIVDGNSIYSHVLATGVTSVFVSASYLYSITNDGTYLYVSNTSANLIQRYSFTGTYVDAVNVGEAVFGISFHNSTLYITIGTAIYELNYGTGAKTQIGTIKSNSVYGLTSNGSDLICCTGFITYTTQASYSYMLGKIKHFTNQDMFNRVLLPSPVTKSQGQTMKVTCTVTFA